MSRLQKCFSYGKSIPRRDKQFLSPEKLFFSLHPGFFSRHKIAPNATWSLHAGHLKSLKTQHWRGLRALLRERRTKSASCFTSGLRHPCQGADGDYRRSLAKAGLRGSYDRRRSQHVCGRGVVEGRVIGRSCRPMPGIRATATDPLQPVKISKSGRSSVGRVSRRCNPLGIGEILQKKRLSARINDLPCKARIRPAMHHRCTISRSPQRDFRYSATNRRWQYSGVDSLQRRHPPSMRSLGTFSSTFLRAIKSMNCFS